jgi:hypothetical protein
VKRTATDEDGEGGVRIEAVEGKPRDAARENRRQAPGAAPRGGGQHKKAFPTPWKAKPKRKA